MIIIGILAAIAIPTFLHQRQNAINASQVSDLRSVAEEIEGFYVNQDQYPSNFNQAGGTVTISTASGTGTQRVTVGNTVTYRLDATGHGLLPARGESAGGSDPGVDLGRRRHPAADHDHLPVLANEGRTGAERSSCRPFGRQVTTTTCRKNSPWDVSCHAGSPGRSMIAASL